MSPLRLRRYRAEKLLHEQFEAMRDAVIAAVRARLGGSGVSIDESDMESAYSQAWQGLYAALLQGEEIHNPAGWLTLVAYRRAIDELRKSRLEVELPAETASRDRELAAEIDDRVRLSQLQQGMQAYLSERERQAAALCYLQGLSRAEAAQQLGISARRMKKLMEGSGPGSPGVAAKVGAIAEAISSGRFCEQQASLMRALAFGMLDPRGRRYRLAVAHQRQCPACRAYVLSLRGLSTALAPVFLPRLLGAGPLQAGAGAAGAADSRSVSTAARLRAGARGIRGPGSAQGLATAGVKLAAVGAVVLGGAAAAALTGLHADARPPSNAAEATTLVRLAPSMQSLRMGADHSKRAMRLRVARKPRGGGGAVPRAALAGAVRAQTKVASGSGGEAAGVWREFGIERRGDSALKSAEATSASQALREFGRK